VRAVVVAVVWLLAQMELLIPAAVVVVAVLLQTAVLAVRA
jgi:hypothetical protein